MKVLTYILILSLSVFSCFAQEVISKIEITGNKIVSKATVISRIKTRAGQTYNANIINEDIKNLNSSGYFDNISVSKESTPKGIVVVFKLKEKPVVSSISIKGAHHVNKLRVKKLVDLKQGSFLDEYKLKEIDNIIEAFYHKRGFSQAQVNYKINVDKKNQAKVIFNIDEGNIVRVKRIIIKGNRSFKQNRIKKLMRTKAKSFFRRGVLNQGTLIDDVKRIEDFYNEHGFGSVKVDYALDYIKGKAYITIDISEGRLYHIGVIKVEGNNKIALGEINKVINIKANDIYVARKINAVVDKIMGVYIDKGYIYAKVNPVTFLNPQTKKMDITFCLCIKKFTIRTCLDNT